MDRRTFLASAAALVAMPPLPTSAGAVTETYATCPAGFALRSWSQDGRSYKAVVPVQRYGEEGGCRWTRYVESMEGYFDCGEGKRGFSIGPVVMQVVE